MFSSASYSRGARGSGWQSWLQSPASVEQGLFQLPLLASASPTALHFYFVGHFILFLSLAMSFWCCVLISYLPLLCVWSRVDASKCELTVLS